MDVLLPLVNRLFKGDNRRVMRQYARNYGILHDGPINDNDWKGHLSGEISAAIYLLNENAQCATVCFDVDIPKLEIPDSQSEREKLKRDQLLPLVRKISDYLLSVYKLSPENLLVEDTGGRGYHLWLFFEFPQDGLKVVNFLNEVKHGCDMRDLEIFPPGSSFGDTGYSKSLVRLPLGTHRKYNNARSVILKLEDFSLIKQSALETTIGAVRFADPGILVAAEERYQKILTSKNLSYVANSKTPVINENYRQGTEGAFIGTVGEMTHLCPALNSLSIKAQREHDLSHNERFALAAILKNYRDGEDELHKILSNCHNYDKEKSEYQIKGIQPCMISCQTLQGPKYKICEGWCNMQFANDAAQGKHPNPGWLSQLDIQKEGVTADTIAVSLKEQIANISNLHHAWKQAVLQSKDREVFEDKLAFELFEKDLWNNLEMLKLQLLNNDWKHNNFLLLEIPKNKDDNTFRPFVSVSPREAIVELAILNVIGPPIDSMFNKSSLGNRLAISPKMDEQIFQDWRKQNRLREFKKKIFTTFEETNHYVITDLKKFYEFIRHDKLLAILKRYIDDQYVLSLIQDYIEASWEGTQTEYGGAKKDIGIPQGPALSAFLANLYLTDVDNWLEEHTIDFVRYVDDIVMVFEDKEVAVKRMTELEALIKDVGLTMSSEKTTEPLPVTDNDPLINWLDEIRYDFVKSSKTGIPLTELEKKELFNTLKRISGDTEKDIKTITRSLGLYIRFTERLGDPDLLKTVHATAAYLLVEDRPRHTAACIAIESLVKACGDLDEEAWQDLSGVYQARSDQYFKILLCQTVGKILQDNETEETPVAIDPKILLLIQGISTDENCPIAAAAAFQVLTAIDDDHYYLFAHQNIAFSTNDFLRPRAIRFLDQIGKINSTSLARLEPVRLIEFEVFIHFITENGTEIFKGLMTSIKSSKVLQLALPLLVRKGLILFENEIGQVWDILPVNVKPDVAYYLANKIISELPMDMDRSANINAIIKFIVAQNISDIGTELYHFARYANILGPEDNVQDVSYDVFEKESIQRLPTPEGITLIKPTFQAKYFVQDAQDDNGDHYYYEYIDSRELNKVGVSLAQYHEALRILLTANMVVLATVYDSLKNGVLIVLTPRSAGMVSLFDHLQNSGNLNPEEILKLMEKVISLVEGATSLLKRSNLKILTPIPCLHTIFIDSEQGLWFGNIGLTIGGEMSYIGKSGKAHRLQQEDPMMEAFGLLLFELNDTSCAVEELIRNDCVEKASLERFAPGKGILFTEIIRKATKPVITDRYVTARFFINDASDWARLEMVLLTDTRITSSDANLLRLLWNLDILISRWMFAEYRGNLSILVYAHSIQKKIINYLRDHDIHRQDWLWKNWSVIADNEKYRKHIAAYQAILFGERIEEKIEFYHNILGLSREMNFPLWLYASAAHIELESLRRGLYKTVNASSFQEEFQQARDFLLNAVNNNLSISIFTDKENGNDRLREAINTLQENIGDITNRLDVWLKNPGLPSANWIHDNQVILFVTMSKYYGLNLLTEDGETINISRSKRLFNKIDTLLFIQVLLNMIKSDLANNGKDKPVPSLRYVISVQGTLKTVNIQLLRDVHRYFDFLNESIYTKFKFKEKVILNITALKKSFEVSKDIIVDENHNHMDTSLAANCVFSLDLDEVDRKTRLPVLASFPILAGKKDSDVLHPIINKEKFSGIKRSRLRYQRRYPVRSAFLDTHTALIFLTALLFWLGIKLFTKSNAAAQVFLNSIVYVYLSIPVATYSTITYRKLVKQNPEYQEFVNNLLGKSKD